MDSSPATSISRGSAGRSALHRDDGGAPDLRQPGPQAGLQDALVWNDKWLSGVLGRPGAAIKCDVSGCRLAKPSPWERSLPPYPWLPA